MTDDGVTAIVLAGGRSSRFGRDKLAEPIDGRSLLERAIDAVRPFSTELLVVAAPAADVAVPPDVRVVRDPSAFEGPLVGLLTGLTAASAEIVLVTAGDMPDLVPSVVEALLAILDDRGVEAALLDHEGQPRPLPMVLRRYPAVAVAARLVAAGERRLGALPEALQSHEIDEAIWRRLDPDGWTMHDIDTPADLARTREESQAHEDPRRRSTGVVVSRRMERQD